MDDSAVVEFHVRPAGLLQQSGRAELGYSSFRVTHTDTNIHNNKFKAIVWVRILVYVVSRVNLFASSNDFECYVFRVKFVEQIIVLGIRFDTYRYINQWSASSIKYNHYSATWNMNSEDYIAKYCDTARTRKWRERKRASGDENMRRVCARWAKVSTSLIV